MKPAPEHPWPPLITNANVPWFTRARDWFLTLLAWLAMAYSLRLGVLVLWDYFSHPILEWTWMQTLDWAMRWERISPFIYMIFAVVIWITVWGMKRRPQIRRNFDPRRLKPPLSLEDHAADLGLDPGEVERWRQWRIVTVNFDGNRIASARPEGTERTDTEKPGGLPGVS